jgi:hypothetical protein
MKHLKLFEEFNKDIWKNVKEFPLTNPEYDYLGIVFSGSDQLLTLMDYFDKLGYATRNTSHREISREEMVNMAEKYPRAVYFWNAEDKIAHWAQCPSEQLESDLKRKRFIKFEDYFARNEKLKGYVTGRNYGI